jgi:hypothetical protein
MAEPKKPDPQPQTGPAQPPVTQEEIEAHTAWIVGLVNGLSPVLPEVARAPFQHEAKARIERIRHAMTAKASKP